MRVYIGILMLWRVPCSGILASYWSAAGFGIFLRFLQVALASHWLEGCANFTPAP